MRGALKVTNPTRHGHVNTYSMKVSKSDLCSPVPRWRFSCRMRWAARRNDFPHSSHRYGFSPVCVLQTESSNVFRNFRSRYYCLHHSARAYILVGNDIPSTLSETDIFLSKKSVISTGELPTTKDKFKLRYF
jgi:hypothetical protein